MRRNSIGKALLAVAVLGIEVVLLRPVVAPTTAQAQGNGSGAGRYQLAVANGEVFVLDTQTGVLKGNVNVVNEGKMSLLPEPKSFTATWETDYKGVPARFHLPANAK